MSFSSPLFAQFNGIKPHEAKVSQAFPIRAVTEVGESPAGVGLFARFALAGAICVSGMSR
jgi:hypothetical protein